MEDESTRDSLFDHGTVKDGHGYYAWLLPKTDVTNFNDQSHFLDIVRKKLGKDSLRDQLEHHLLRLEEVYMKTHQQSFQVYLFHLSIEI